MHSVLPFARTVRSEDGCLLALVSDDEAPHLRGQIPAAEAFLTQSGQAEAKPLRAMRCTLSWTSAYGSQAVLCNRCVFRLT